MAPKPVLWNGTDAQGNPLLWNTQPFVWNGTVPQPQTSKHMPHLRVSLAFVHDTEQNLHTLASAVSAGLFGNPAYPDPGMEKAVLDDANSAFDTAITTAKHGSPKDTADKHNLRDALIALLRRLASYVQMKHGDDLAVLLSSGFEAVSTNHAPAVLTAPHIREILNGKSGELIARVDAMDNVRVFRARFAVVGPGGVPGPWQDGGLHGDSRRIVLGNLVPGTMYSVQIQAVAGGRNESDWSDPMQHMSM